MKNRREKDYIVLLTKISALFKEKYGSDLNPAAIHTDGETGAINGFKKVFGKDTPIKLCIVHFYRNWDKHLEEEIGKKFIKNKIVQLIRMTFKGCVYFQMSDGIRKRLIAFTTEVAEKLDGTTKSGILTYITYLKNNYLKKDAQFNSTMWDYNMEILDKGIFDMTNNVSESVNRVFKSSFDHGFKTFHKATAGINTFKSKYYQMYVRKVPKKKFNRRRLKTIRNEDTATQLLHEFSKLSEKQAN